MTDVEYNLDQEGHFELPISNLQINKDRDDKITDFGKSVLKDRYLIPGEDYQDLFMRVAKYYSDNDVHAERLYNYISNHWFMPSTPILSNGNGSWYRFHVF